MAEDADALVAELTTGEWKWLAEGFQVVAIDALQCLGVPISSAGGGAGIFCVPAIPAT